MTTYAEISPGSRTSQIPCLTFLALAALSWRVDAWADNKHAAPAPRAAAAPRAPAGMAGAARMPNNMSGTGAHLPSGMAASGAHVPANMAGGNAHLPSSMSGSAAHIPGSMAERGAHVPDSRTATAHSSAGTQAGGHRPGSVANGAHSPSARGASETAARERPASNSHPALAAGAARRTEGAQDHSNHVAGRDNRSGAAFMHADAHRDIAREHAAIAGHLHDFHTRLVRDFNPYERARWRGGNWRDGWQYGRRGWWWNADGGWYPYADPIFPYPLEVAVPVVYQTALVDGPDPLPPPASDQPDGAPMPQADETASPGAAERSADRTIPLLPAAPPVRYSCADPAGIYPDTETCNGPWQVAQNDAQQNPN